MKPVPPIGEMACRMSVGWRSRISTNSSANVRRGRGPTGGAASIDRPRNAGELPGRGPRHIFIGSRGRLGTRARGTCSRPDRETLNDQRPPRSVHGWRDRHHHHDPRARAAASAWRRARGVAAAHPDGAELRADVRVHRDLLEQPPSPAAYGPSRGWPILWANIDLLFWLSITPFATAWMGDNHFAPLPVAAYGGDLFMLAIAFTILVRA